MRFEYGQYCCWSWRLEKVEDKQSQSGRVTYIYLPPDVEFVGAGTTCKSTIITSSDSRNVQWHHITFFELHLVGSVHHSEM